MDFTNRTQYNLTWLLNGFDYAEQLKFIFFWGHTGKNEIGQHCFSQWFELPFVVNGVTYPTAEHWMMAHKALLFNDTATFYKIINAAKPGEVKALGRQIANFEQPVWDDEKYKIVLRGNIHKFNQHPQYAEYLLNTGDQILVEASPVDRIWGIGLAKNAENLDNPHFWNGQNLLGFALMEARDFLRTVGHFSELENIPALPWTAYPGFDPLDGFWRMGRGEDLIIEFARYYDSLDLKQKAVLKLTHPEPSNWKGFYEG